MFNALVGPLATSSLLVSIPWSPVWFTLTPKKVPQGVLWVQVWAQAPDWVHNHLGCVTTGPQWLEYVSGCYFWGKISQTSLTLPNLLAESVLRVTTEGNTLVFHDTRNRGAIWD
jgi:hypothetical protein